MTDSEQDFQNWLADHPQPMMQPVHVSRIVWEESKKHEREALAARNWIKYRSHGEG